MTASLPTRQLQAEVLDVEGQEFFGAGGGLVQHPPQDPLAKAVPVVGEQLVQACALERDMIHQRTMAGLAAARAQGRVGGRPSVMDADKLAAATARLARGESPDQIAKALGVSRATLYRHTDVVTARGQS